MFASNELVDAVILHSSIVVFEHISSEMVLMLANNVGTINSKQYTLLQKLIVIPCTETNII